MNLAPQFEGELEVNRLPEDFSARIGRRVESGLLGPGRGRRADYRVRSIDSGAIAFGSEGLLTSYNLGLNEVTVRRVGASRLQYRVTYWRWTVIAVVQGMVLGIAAVLAYSLWPEMRRDIGRYPIGPFLFWSQVAFWGLLWPWLLSLLHRGPAERALRRILVETLTQE